MSHSLQSIEIANCDGRHESLGAFHQCTVAERSFRTGGSDPRLVASCFKGHTSCWITTNYGLKSNYASGPRQRHEACIFELRLNWIPDSNVDVTVQASCRSAH